MRAAVVEKERPIEELFSEFLRTRAEDLKWEIVLRHSNMIKSIALRLHDVYASFRSEERRVGKECL